MADTDLTGHEALAWIQQELAKERRQKREMVTAIREGIRAADPVRFFDGIQLAELHVVSGWRLIMLTVRRCPPPPAKFHRWFRDAMWVPKGDHIRCEVVDDLLLADALRVLLPPYRGSDMRLWRGEQMWNRRCRTYGLPWSRRAAVAHAYARGMMRTAKGGSVVLEADVPAEAIICVVPSRSDRYGEREVLVDRRQLSQVRVIERYSQAARQEASLGIFKEIGRGSEGA